MWAGIEKRVADSPAPVRSIAHRKRPTVRWVLAAAAAIVLIVAGTITVVRRRSNDDVLSATVLRFERERSWIPRGTGASAEAVLINEAGKYEIGLTNSKLPAVAGDDLELWLHSAGRPGQPQRHRACGAGTPATATDACSVIAGLDPKSHYVVDISIEPHDGDAAHSGQSIRPRPTRTGVARPAWPNCRRDVVGVGVAHLERCRHETVHGPGGSTRCAEATRSHEVASIGAALRSSEVGDRDLVLPFEVERYPSVAFEGPCWHRGRTGSPVASWTYGGAGLPSLP